MCENDGYTGRIGHVFQTINSGNLTLDTGAYANGDALIDGYITWSCCSQSKGWGVCVKQVNIHEDAGSGNTAQTLPGDLLIFNKPPTSQTKNSAISLVQADILALKAIITVTAGGSYNTRYSFKNHDTDKWVDTYQGSETVAGDTALYGIFVINTAKTFATGTILQINLGLLKD